MERKSRDCILAKYDVSGIQDYIYATNRLRENAGASYQVTRILKDYLPEVLKEEAEKMFSGTERIIVDWKAENKLNFSEDENTKAEVIYIGGGNAVVLYGDRKLYQKVGESLAKKTAENCSGIYLVAAYISTTLQNFSKDMKNLDERLENVKNKMVKQPVYSPFPVVEQDNLCHQPITRLDSLDEAAKNITEIQFQKREAYKNLYKGETENKKKDMSLFPEIKGIEYEYPEEMDELCREKGKDSYIAIIHIDGNGMGEQIKELLEKNEDYEEGVANLREKSKYISRLFNNTYAKVLTNLCEEKEAFFDYSDKKDEVQRKGKFLLRPIILDGDDFTILCTADLAIPIAVGFLKELFKQQQGEERKITACAGIAVVHSHFPFRVAYSIAEESCSRAKRKWYKEKKRQSSPKGYLDFQIIKESEVGLSQKSNDWKPGPYSVGEIEAETDSDSIKKLYKVLKEMAEKWPSNRLHRIYRALQSDENTLLSLKKEFESRGYYIDNLLGNEEEKFPAYDALEILGICHLKLFEKYLNL